MQAINFLRASICNSSYSAFKLALENSKHIDFAKRIIIVKNESAHHRLLKLNPNNSDYWHTKIQALKYNSFLSKLNYISGLDSLTDTSFHFSNLNEFKKYILINQ